MEQIDRPNLDENQNRGEPQRPNEEGLANPQAPEDPSRQLRNQAAQPHIINYIETQLILRRLFLGECLGNRNAQSQGIFLYKPGAQLPDLYQFVQQRIKIIIASEYIKRQNPQVLRRKIYGCHPYTSNSDAVCILFHWGHKSINNLSINGCKGVELICQVSRSRTKYSGSLRNGIKSRNIKNFNDYALTVEGVNQLEQLGSMEQLQRYAGKMIVPIGKNRIKPRPKNISDIIPVPETHIVFNMNNEPAHKYSMINIADKGIDKSQYMISKMENYVLYLQTQDRKKYELVKNFDQQPFNTLKLSEVKHPELIDNEYFAEKNAPLEADQVEVICDQLEWKDIRWGNVSISIKNLLRIEGLTSFKYYKKSNDSK